MNTETYREAKRYKKLISILFANGQELTEAGIKFAIASLENRTPLEAALDINFTQNNMNSQAPILFVEI